MSLPRAQFLPQKPLMIRPRLSSRERREPPVKIKKSGGRKWKEAFLISLIVIGGLAGLYLAFDCAVSALTWFYRWR